MYTVLKTILKFCFAPTVNIAMWKRNAESEVGKFLCTFRRYKKNFGSRSFG